eukprot:TRINITY_DN17227_c0_g1_i1.p1 TRINITY_DN17227_c0_g1~~TRINITY_DN17227_c0_g1_i1.p1  ORF type:complete len:614 (+),score=140.47 TRINITY_DN17227_c0_g1_i1:77-1918(+)
MDPVRTPRSASPRKESLPASAAPRSAVSDGSEAAACSPILSPCMSARREQGGKLWLGRSLRSAVSFDRDNEGVRRDVLEIIAQHLEEQDLTTAAYVLRDEARMRERDRESRRKHQRQMVQAILDGNWGEVNRLLLKTGFKGQKSLHYSLAKQQYLELIEAGDGSKAYTFLKKTLKPLEPCAPPGEFTALSYLLVCKSVSEAPGAFFRSWQEDAARQRLVSDFKHLLDPDARLPRIGAEAPPPPGRLWELLHQACGYQVLSQPHCPPLVPEVTTLLRDYAAPLCPNSSACVLQANDSVKCCVWLRASGDLLGFGGSDGAFRTCHLAPSGIGTEVIPGPLNSFRGHSGRVWDVCRVSDTTAVTASADGSLKVWDTSDALAATPSVRVVCTLQGHRADVYSVRAHPGGSFVASGGYDGTVRLWNLEQQREVRVFTAHKQAVTSVAFNHYGNMVVSGSKDGSVRFWDVASGVCLLTVKAERVAPSAVTSVDLSLNGSTLLVGHQDSSNRLWDLGSGQGPTQRAVRLQGHANTARSFVRCCFGPGEFVFGGSEDGAVCIWAANTGSLVSRLLHGDGESVPAPVFDVRWCQAAGRLVSCGGDRTLRVWAFNPDLPYVSV